MSNIIQPTFQTNDPALTAQWSHQHYGFWTQKRAAPQAVFISTFVVALLAAAALGLIYAAKRGLPLGKIQSLEQCGKTVTLPLLIGSSTLAGVALITLTVATIERHLLIRDTRRALGLIQEDTHKRSRFRRETRDYLRPVFDRTSLDKAANEEHGSYQVSAVVVPHRVRREKWRWVKEVSHHTMDFWVDPSCCRPARLVTRHYRRVNWREEFHKPELWKYTFAFYVLVHDPSNEVNGCKRFLHRFSDVEEATQFCKTLKDKKFTKVDQNHSLLRVDAHRIRENYLIRGRSDRAPAFTQKAQGRLNAAQQFINAS